MKLTCSNFEDLLTKLNDLSIVAEDNMSSDDKKNIIFHRGESGVTLISWNQLITLKCGLPFGEYVFESEDGDAEYYQVRCKELIAFLRAYQNSARTKVETVEFITTKDRVRCIVNERENETEVLRTSSWSFVNIPIKPNMLANIALNIEAGTELQYLSKDNVMLYTRNLLPLMQNSTNLFGSLIFDAENVVAFAPAFTTIIRNELNDVFSAIRLSYRSIQFMDKVVTNSEEIGVFKTDRHIYVKLDNYEAFIIYDTKLASYKAYLDLFKKDHAFVLDRVYLREVLKRLSLSNDAIEFKLDCTEKKVTLKNSKYMQELDVLQTKNIDEFGTIEFKVMPDVLNKAVIGNDVDFSPNLFVYYCPNDAGNAVVLSDDSGAWFSIMRVNAK